MRSWLAGGAVVGFLGLASGEAAGDRTTQPQARAAAGDCVTIGTPKPTVTYVYQHSESRGKVTEMTTTWESVTATGSRSRTTGPQGVVVQVNEHHIADDVAILDKSTKLDARGTAIDTTAFRPGIVSDPAFRACAGRSWPIPSVTASYQSAQANASSPTPAGTLRIVAVRERVTVPAGTFDTVRYVRTSQSTDEYWKSIEHGVVVKHVATLPAGTMTEVLSAIR
jgi:hypothetical protein